MLWTGSIILSPNDSIADVNFDTSPDENSPFLFEDVSSLRFLSVVETTQIPLHLIIGSPWTVSTSSAETERWFSGILGASRDEKGLSGTKWWETARPDSPLGILVSIDSSEAKHHVSGLRMTELLFYASREDSLLNVPPSPHSPRELDGDAENAPKTLSRLKVNAIALSSELLHSAAEAEPTPPASPKATDEAVEGVFLPVSYSSNTEMINEPPVRKRKSAADAFDEASERRKKARKQHGEGVAAAAASKFDSQVPTLKHSCSTSNSQQVPMNSRPLSRSPSIASSRPPAAVTAGQKRSTLSRVQSAAEPLLGSSLIDKNKDIISRIVMAGMRLYGLSRDKSRKSRASSSAPSPAVDESFEDLEAERKGDEEFKLIYHQVFKGTCFAFRTRIDIQGLQPLAEPIRDVVDRLLAIFCNDPLASGLAAMTEKLTPGGRKGFGPQLAIGGENACFAVMQDKILERPQSLEIT